MSWGLADGSWDGAQLRGSVSCHSLGFLSISRPFLSPEVAEAQKSPSWISSTVLEVKLEAEASPLPQKATETAGRGFGSWLWKLLTSTRTPIL